MENPKPACSSFIISLLFYVCYFFYFGLYSFEIIFMVSAKKDYVMLFILLITTILSISLASTGLMYTSFFLVIVMSLVEMYEYKNSSFVNAMDDEFSKLFLIVRLFATVNFLLFYYLHINNLKRKKRMDLAKSKSTEKKTQTQTQTVHERNSPEYKNDDLRHGAVLPVGGKLIQEVVTPTHMHTHKHTQDNDDPSKKTQVIEGYILKHVTIPIIEKDDRSPLPALSNQQSKVFEVPPHHLPYSHYSVKSVDNNAHGLGANQPLSGGTFVDDSLDETYRRQYTSPWVVPTITSTNNNNNNNSLYGNGVSFAGAESQHLNRTPYGNATANACYNGGLNAYPANRLPDDREPYQVGPHQMGAYQSGAYQSGAYQSGAYQTGGYQKGAYQAGA
ncbi:hypothetical protein PCYB_073270 [Plasmodium cynomolgi strain B]|uniref:Uncharacterized protein n=1 Tax=Plasmodium cynomolgi (strain B) TaxID=1120755 RepID=K6UUE8_PLACD|nr:hypothetical protein PCYB_073270 [Plasmodium cynomolgi strain B]GAB65825.1 hypothetical protein PCYB_073270 [Plasmodium cynomolgi strain B]